MVLVIFVFLRNFWATIIPAIAVPLSHRRHFRGDVRCFGYSLDNLSLMGLTIAVGFVVDDAIVMIENIVRHIEEGETPFEAALKGAGQIGFTIISITCSLIAVFIPLIFMGGIIGRLFREFAVTVAIAVVDFGVRLADPDAGDVLAFLKHENAGKSTAASTNGRGRRSTRCSASMTAACTWVLRHQFLTLLSTLALIVLTGCLYVSIPKGFFPQQDTGFIFGDAEARAGHLVRRHVASCSCSSSTWSWPIRPSTASSALPARPAATRPRAPAACYIQLKPFDQRDVTADQVIAAAAPEGRRKCRASNSSCRSAQDINVGGRLSRTQYQYTLTDTDLDELNDWAPKLEQAMREAAGAAGRRLRPADRRRRMSTSRSIAMRRRGSASRRG